MNKLIVEIKWWWTKQILWLGLPFYEWALKHASTNDQIKMYNEINDSIKRLESMLYIVDDRKVIRTINRLRNITDNYYGEALVKLNDEMLKEPDMKIEK